jgi:NAD(P)-dependent dehydrogenase (short-subunit alcohol dehydrogenase family)
MENLTDKIAVVLGGTGGVGEGIVRGLLVAGATVIVPSRSESNLQDLKEYVSDIKTGTLIPFIGSVNTEENALALSNYLHQNYKSIDIVVASLGGWKQGFPIYSYPVKEWRQILDDALTSHFLAIKTLVPMLHPDTGSYFHINGFGSEEVVPMAGPITAMAAAQKSLILTLATEVNRTGMRVYELILGPMMTRDRLKHSAGKPDWYYPEEIGQYIVNQTLTPTQHDIIHRLLSKNDATA